MTEIRKLTGEELRHSLALSQYAFQYSISDDEISERIEQQKENEVLAIFDGESLASKLHILPLAVYIQEKEIKMGGIAGVATWPEYRRKKYVKALIIEALKHMKEHNQIVSFLAPFKINFYRKFGWELISYLAKLEIKNADLKPFAQVNGSTKRITKNEAFQQLNRIYETFSKQYNGMLKRTEQWWLNNVYDNDYHFIMYISEMNEPTGYLLYKVKDRIMDVQEMVFLDEQARGGLWNFICQHDSMVETVKITTTEEDKLAYLLENPSIKKEVTPYFMGRIVDALAFLKQYPFSPTDSLFLHLYDEFAPWNNGTYHLHNGEVTFYQKEGEGASCVHPPKRGIQLNSCSLSAILIGGLRPAFLYNAKKISGNERDISLFEEIIPKKSSFFLDFF